jgi:hypothetical protein
MAGADRFGCKPPACASMRDSKTVTIPLPATASAPPAAPPTGCAREPERAWSRSAVELAHELAAVAMAEC